jgi:hypothetical protein
MYVYSLIVTSLFVKNFNLLSRNNFVVRYSFVAFNLILSSSYLQLSVFVCGFFLLSENDTLTLFSRRHFHEQLRKHAVNQASKILRQGFQFTPVVTVFCTIKFSSLPLSSLSFIHIQHVHFLIVISILTL